MEPATFVLLLPVLIFSIIFHECAHGWVADKLGDPTARLSGRITLNPLPHVDIVGTILIPLMLVITQSPFLFGYAKPVPVNYHNLKNPQRDMLWIGLSGPISNIFLMFVSAIIWKLLMLSNNYFTGGNLFDSIGLSARVAMPLINMVRYSILINMVLAAFNLIPIPPLDGSRVLMGLLPRHLAEQYAQIEPYGFFIIILLLMTGTLSRIVSPMFEGMYYLLSWFHLWPHY